MPTEARSMEHRLRMVVLPHFRRTATITTVCLATVGFEEAVGILAVTRQSVQYMEDITVVVTTSQDFLSTWQKGVLPHRRQKAVNHTHDSAQRCRHANNDWTTTKGGKGYRVSRGEKHEGKSGETWPTNTLDVETPRAHNAQNGGNLDRSLTIRSKPGDKTPKGRCNKCSCACWKKKPPKVTPERKPHHESKLLLWIQVVTIRIYWIPKIIV